MTNPRITTKRTATLMALTLAGCPEPSTPDDSETGGTESGEGDPGDGDPGDGDPGDGDPGDGDPGDGDGDGDPGDGDGDPGDGDGDPGDGDGDPGDGDPGDGDGDCVAGSEGCACDMGACAMGLNCVDDLCAQPSCGDGLVDVGEACDDGNADNTDACTDACELAACGDGFIQAGEDCDDGNTQGGDGCGAFCVDGGVMLWETVWDPNDQYGRIPQDVVVDGDGDIIVAGQLFHTAGSSGYHWAALDKFDGDGQNLWSQSWINPQQDDGDWFLAVTADSAGNIYAGGEEQSGEPDWLAVKYDGDGNWQWEELYDVWTVEQVHAAIADSNDDVVMAGHDSSVNGYDGHLRKYAPDGTVLWTRTINTGGGVEITEGIVEMQNGDYVTLTRGTNPQLRRFTSAGGVVWTVPITGLVNWDHLSVDPQDRLVAVTSGFNMQSSSFDFQVTQYDGAGNELWTVVHDQAGNSDTAYSVEADADGNIYVAAQVHDAQNTAQAWLGKYDVDGNPVWTVVEASLDYMDFRAVTVAPDGGVVVCGTERVGQSFYVDFDIVLRKYAP